MTTSYDELLKQVEALRSENSHLRRELQDNSSHLTKLENEATNMKVLCHLQTSSVGENLNDVYQQHEAAYTPSDLIRLDQNLNHEDSSSSSASELPVIPPRPLGHLIQGEGQISSQEEPTYFEIEKPTADQNHLHQGNTESQTYLSPGEVKGEGQNYLQVEGQPDDSLSSHSSNHSNEGCVSAGQKSENTSPCGSPNKKHKHSGEHDPDREYYSKIQELDQQRNVIFDEVEEEEKVRQWYCEQIEALDRRIQALPLTADSYNPQSDMARRQLEHEAHRIRSSMHEKLGTADQMASRHKSRLHRIQMVETEMLRLQQRHNKRESRSQGEGPGPGPGPGSGSNLDSASNISEQYGIVDQGTETGPNYSAIYQGAWPINQDGPEDSSYVNQETASVMSFSSSHASTNSKKPPQQHLGPKVEMVYSLLTMLGTHDKDDMSRTLLAMSSSQDSCIAMRQSGCLPLLIQLLHGSDKDSGLLGNTRGSIEARARAAAALHNIVHSHPDDKKGRREARVLRLLEQIRAHCDHIHGNENSHTPTKSQSQGSRVSDMDHHPGPAIAALMKLSFDEEHRHAICTLGGLQAIAELLQVDSERHGMTRDQYTITMRRYACMALTNLTFGDGTNKALLCSMKLALQALVNQLQSPNEDLAQVAASVLRNLSWRADLASKKALRDVDSVTTLTRSAMRVKKESTLKSILSALWNLSAHCSENKVDICAVDGALGFLVNTLTYKSPSKTLAIIENGGGILRNISSHIAVREDYRKVLRKHGCLLLLLKHLRSPSLTIVSNACGTLWNLSARCQEDQEALWGSGAVSMLRNLVHSKHKMISMGSAAALKNLLAARPNISINGEKKHSSAIPTLQIRKQRALEAEIDQDLSETCENIESPQASPTETRKQRQLNGPKPVHSGPKPVHSGENGGIQDRRFHGIYNHGKSNSVDNSPMVEKFLAQEGRHVKRSDSQDSVGSAHSDVTHNRTRNRSSEQYGRKNSDNMSDIGGASNRLMQMMQEIVSGAGIDDRDEPKQQSNQMPPVSILAAKMEQMNLNRSGGPMGYMPNGPSNLWSRPTRFNSLPQTSASLNLNMSQQYSSNNMSAPNTTMAQVYGYGSVPYSVYNQQAPEMQPQNHAQMANSGFNGSPYVNRKMASMPGNMPNQTQQCNMPSMHNNQMYPALNSLTAGGMIPQNSQHSKPHYPPSHPSMSQLIHQQKQSQLAHHQKQQFPHQQHQSFAPAPPAGQPQYMSHYADTDLDNDQPTNFSLRYRENPYMEPIDVTDEDQIKTFCTEGTPLNYLSTATSMDDLTGLSKSANDDSKLKSGITDEDRHQSEHHSGSGTNSTERKTIIESPRSRNPPRTVLNQLELDQTGGQPLHIYNDKDNPHSPKENTKEFYMEGTPLCFSRVSSLSSLHSTDACDQRDFESHNPALQSIRENEVVPSTSSPKITSANQSYRPESNTPETILNQNAASGPGGTLTSSAPMVTPGSERDSKSVSFDDQTSHHVQDTPMMFSRCSSLGSLSSFDAHSVHSSVLSEYSRRASEVVSPSDLPDSPSDSMPPTRSESPSNKQEGTATTEIDKRAVYRNYSSNLLRTRPHPNVPPSIEEKDEVFQFKESTKAYADEDTPTNFSCASSLSALTIDDEPKIEKDIELRPRKGLGPTRDKNSNKLQPNKAVSEPIPEESESESSSMSESEADMLQQCINIGMPTTSSKKKVRKSSSDNSIKKKTSNKESQQSDGKHKQIGNSRIPKSNTIPGEHAQGFYGDEHTRTYVTEDTPLNFSAATSLSDLSVTSGWTNKCDKSHKNIRSQGQPNKINQDEDSSSGDDDELLSQMIQSAMPKKQKHSKKERIDRTAEGCDDKGKDLFNQQNSQSSHVPAQFQPLRTSSHKSPAAKIDPNKVKPQNVNTQSLQNRDRRSSSTQSGPSDVSQGRVGSFGGSDTVRCYKTEDTPIHLSTATSLSDITMDDSDNHPARKGSGNQSNGTNIASNAATYGNVDEDSVFFHTTSYDSPVVYGIEGTPLSFSRNDSLSSLSCDDASDLGVSRSKKLGKEITKKDMNLTSRSMTFEHRQMNAGIRLPGDGMKSQIPMARNRGMSSPVVSNTTLPVNIQSGSVNAGSATKSKTDVSKYSKQQVRNPVIHNGVGHLQGQQLRVSSMSQQTANPSNQPNLTKKHHQQHRPPYVMVNSVPPMSHNLPSNHQILEDVITHYAVEGTPMSFSRASPLSSLAVSDDEQEVQAPPVGGMTDNIEQKTEFKVEDTPACFSCNSSLSSLSVDSSSYEPTANEQALLDECLSSVLPAHTKKSNKDMERKSNLSRSSPSGTSGNASPDSRQVNVGQQVKVKSDDKVQKANGESMDKKIKEVTNMQRSLTDNLDYNRRSQDLTDQIQALNLNNIDLTDEKSDSQKQSPIDTTSSGQSSSSDVPSDGTCVEIHRKDEELIHTATEENVVLFESTILLPIGALDKEGNVTEPDDFEAKISYEMDALEINENELEIDVENLSGDKIGKDFSRESSSELTSTTTDSDTDVDRFRVNSMSPTEEFLLAEGAQIAVSELTSTRNMAESTTDEECIEDESISLIMSTDGTIEETGNSQKGKAKPGTVSAGGKLVVRKTNLTRTGSTSSLPGVNQVKTVRPSTPTGSSSPAAGGGAHSASTTPKKGLGQKKQIVSKIASLWKKDNDVEKVTQTKPASPRSSVKQKVTNGTTPGTTEVSTGLSRSATYDKIPTGQLTPVNQECVKINSKSKNSTPEKRRTYVICDDAAEESKEKTAKVQKESIGSHDDIGSAGDHGEVGDIWVLQDGSSIASLEMLETRSSTSTSNTSLNHSQNGKPSMMNGSVSCSLDSVNYDTMHCDPQSSPSKVQLVGNTINQNGGIPNSGRSSALVNKKTPEPRQSREAIVQPFNYKPKATTTNTLNNNDTSPLSNQDTASDITKTERLTNANDKDKGKKKCIVTTV